MVLVRGAFIQIVPNERLASLKRPQFETSIQIRARRGAILDRNGKELAASVPSYSLWADPKLIRGPDHVAGKLAHVLKRAKIGTCSSTFASAGGASFGCAASFRKSKWRRFARGTSPGLGFIEESKRIYPNGSLLAQTLGFVGTDGRGLEGLELQFDKQLRGGLKNVLLPRDKLGRPLLAERSSVDRRSRRLGRATDHRHRIAVHARAGVATGARSARGLARDGRDSRSAHVRNFGDGNAAGFRSQRSVAIFE